MKLFFSITPLMALFVSSKWRAMIIYLLSLNLPLEWGPSSTHVSVLSRFSCAWLLTTLWIIAHQAPLSMEFSRQEYWSGLPCPPPGDLPDPGIETMSLKSLALADGFFTTSATWEATPSLAPVVLVRVHWVGNSYWLR